MTSDCYEQARALHRAGEIGPAEALYRRALDAEPGHHRALNNLGSICEAQGRTAEAEQAYRRALAAAPDSAVVHFNLGRLVHLGGRLSEAEALYRSAAALDPALAGAHFNLGRLLQELERPVEAELALRRSAELDPGGAAARSLLGDALFAQHRLPEALEAYRRTVELAPGDPAAAFDVGKTLESMRRADEAVECYRRSLELEPGSDPAREALARALHAAGRRDEAVASLRAWLEREPGSELAGHLLAALGGADAPERASDGYVRGTFDRFAADFDRTLERLRYDAPRLCAGALAAQLGAPAGALRVLDAGCGTGLCAPLLRPWAARLEGVDLSPGMLERARTRGGYDALHEGELTAFLAGTPGAWDAVVSADTFCYLGALEAPLAAAFGALAPGGVLVFTVEHEESPGRFRLQEHGRYAHADGYVRAALAGSGFVDATLEPVTLRLEGRVAVRGLLVSARRGPAAG
jgi:predicted TPR repeat methyltransferase